MMYIYVFFALLVITAFSACTEEKMRICIQDWESLNLPGDDKQELIETWYSGLEAAEQAKFKSMAKYGWCRFAETAIKWKQELGLLERDKPIKNVAYFQEYCLPTEIWGEIGHFCDRETLHNIVLTARGLIEVVTGLNYEEYLSENADQFLKDASLRVKYTPIQGFMQFKFELFAILSQVWLKSKRLQTGVVGNYVGRQNFLKWIVQMNKEYGLGIKDEEFAKAETSGCIWKIYKVIYETHFLAGLINWNDLGSFLAEVDLINEDVIDSRYSRGIIKNLKSGKSALSILPSQKRLNRLTAFLDNESKLKYELILALAGNTRTKLLSGIELLRIDPRMLKCCSLKSKRRLSGKMCDALYRIYKNEKYIDYAHKHFEAIMEALGAKFGKINALLYYALNRPSRNRSAPFWNFFWKLDMSIRNQYTEQLVLNHGWIKLMSPNNDDIVKFTQTHIVPLFVRSSEDFMGKILFEEPTKRWRKIFLASLRNYEVPLLLQAYIDHHWQQS